MIISGCTELVTFPAQVETAKPAVHNNQADATPRTSPTRQLEAMHASHASSQMDIAWIFQYYRLISTVSLKVLNDEFERTKLDFSKRKTAWNQWQLAMLLSLPAAPFHNPQRSATLFKQLADAPGDQDPVINDAAFLMYSWVKEQAKTSKKVSELEGRLAESRSANKTLQDQLNALKAIEENLYQRNKVEVPPQP
ncbi:MAG: hypothetical protein P8164_05275 [Gammaproteobacteria bacterium]